MEAILFFTTPKITVRGEKRGLTWTNFLYCEEENGKTSLQITLCRPRARTHIQSVAAICQHIKCIKVFPGSQPKWKDQFRRYLTKLLQQHRRFARAAGTGTAHPYKHFCLATFRTSWPTNALHLVRLQVLTVSHATRQWGMTPCRLVISRTQQERRVQAESEPE